MRFFSRQGSNRKRPLIAFFGYHDVFEDFYPHYGVSQKSFATSWVGSGNHHFLRLLQRDIGDVVWYELSLAPELNDAVHERTGCRVRLLPSSWLHRRLWRIFYLSKSSWRWQSFYRTYATLASYLALLSFPVLRTLFKERPDILFTQDYATGRFDVLLFLAKLLGVPLIAYHAGSRPEYYLGQFIKRFTIPHASCLIASSRRELKMLANQYHVSGDRLRMILTPIDLKTFHPCDRAEACQALGFDPALRYIIFVGRLDDRIKRVSALIKAFAKLSPRYPGVLLLIVGEGQDGKTLEKLASGCCPGRVTFINWVTEQEKLVSLYNMADCLFLPSRKEGFPTVVGEAMACGTPVSGSDVGGVAELVVPGKTGWLVPPDDDEALVHVLRDVLEHPEALLAMQQEARTITETRVAEHVISGQLHECFSKTLLPDT